MKHFQQSFISKANPTAVYSALTTPEGVCGWRTYDCDGKSEMGGTIDFRFGLPHKEMRVEVLQPASEVRWRCTAAHIDIDQFKHKDE